MAANLAVNPAGQALFVFIKDKEYWAAQGSPDGTIKPFTRVLPAPERGTLYSGPVLAIGPTGEGAIAQATPDGVRVVWMRASGEFEAPQVFPGFFESIRFDHHGNAGIVVQRTGDDGSAQLAVAWRRAGAAAFGAPEHTVVTQGASSPQLMFLENGPMLVWSGVEPGQPNGLQHIYASFGTVDGPFTKRMVISDPKVDSGGDMFPQMLTESNANGDAIIAWASGDRGLIDVITRRRGAGFKATRFPNSFRLAGGGVSADGTFFVGWQNPFGAPPEIRRDDGGGGGLQKLFLPAGLFGAKVLGIDGLGNFQMLVSRGKRIDQLGTHGVLRDGTIGAFDELTVLDSKDTGGDGFAGFDARGYGWFAFGDKGTDGLYHTYVSRYDGRKVTALQPPAIAGVRYRRVPKPKKATASAIARGAVVAFTVSKTSRVKLSLRCQKAPKGRRCKSRKEIAWKLRVQMGTNGIAVPRSARRRLKAGARYRLTLTARDSHGKLSKPKTITARP